MRPPAKSALFGLTILAVLGFAPFALREISISTAHADEVDERNRNLKVEYCLPRQQWQAANLCSDPSLAANPQMQSTCRDIKTTTLRMTQMVTLYSMRIQSGDTASMTELLLARKNGEQDFQECMAPNACMDSCSAKFTKPSDAIQLGLCFKKCVPDVCKHISATCDKIKDALPY